MNNFKYCGNCGKKIRSNTKFCPYCGAKQSNGARMSTQPTYKIPTRHRKWINSGKHKLTLLVIIIIIVILGFVCYQHSEASINLNREIPNNTWKLKGDWRGHTMEVNNTHFYHNSMSGDSKQADLDQATIRPTGRKTANLVFGPNGSSKASILMKVTKGNKNSFRLSSIHKSTMDDNGHHITVHNNEAYMDGKRLHKFNDKNLDFTMYLTRE